MRRKIHSLFNLSKIARGLKGILRMLWAEFNRSANQVAPNSAKFGDYVSVTTDCAFGKGTRLLSHVQLRHTVLGDYTSIGEYTIVRNAVIGKYCSISWLASIGAPAHYTDRIATHNAFLDNQIENSKVQTQIGNDVWIGCGVIIKAGVVIGDGAVVGAGSVVTKDVMPYSICAGVPAKHIRMRFDDGVNERIHALKWWDWPDKLIEDKIKMFREEMSEALVSEFEQISLSIMGGDE